MWAPAFDVMDGSLVTKMPRRVEANLDSVGVRVLTVAASVPDQSPT
ncbi:hypothetical protein VT84_14755 [Gemmata sp. SH-PL17]|nr:hypothetical protein VT84_14755 [Gemmata sp. SH-PL17]